MALKTVSVDLPAEIFDVATNVPLIHQVVVAQQAAARQGMGPATDSAEIIVGPDGKGHLRGTPTPAAGNPLPDLNPEPDPVDKIDKSKVGDSVQLTVYRYYNEDGTRLSDYEKLTVDVELKILD